TRAQSGRDQMSDFLTHLLGPLASIPLDAVEGASQLMHGEVLRSLEHFLPMGLRGVPKTARYATEGVRGPNALPGEEVVPKEQLSTYDKILQALNLTTEKVANAYDSQNARANMKGAIYQRANDIVNHLVLAYSQGDDKEIDRAGAERDHFIEAHPGLAPMFSSDEIANRIKKAGSAVDGVTMPKSLIGDPSMERLGPGSTQ